MAILKDIFNDEMEATLLRTLHPPIEDIPASTLWNVEP